MKLTKIYTRTGDAGKTSLVGGIRVSKDSARLEAYGTVDELSSHLGLLVASLDMETRKLSNSETGHQLSAISSQLERIQNDLFNVCSYLATDTSNTPVYASAKLDPEEITFLEEQMDMINQEFPVLNSFILPGGSLAASQCHICRTVCRRAERRIVTLMNEILTNSVGTSSQSASAVPCDTSHDFNPDMLKYINRLSDYLFVLARKLNIIYSIDEKTWQNTCK